MIDRLLGRTALLCLTLALVVACQRGDAVSGPRQTAVQDQGQAAARPARPGTVGQANYTNVTGEALGKGIFIGAARSYGNLTVFPVLAKTQIDVGPLISLHDALEKGTVELRELKQSMRDALQRENQRSKGEGRGQVSEDRVTIPDEEGRSQGEFRDDILKGMKQQRLDDYTDEIQRYYESLME